MTRETKRSLESAIEELRPDAASDTTELTEADVKDLAEALGVDSVPKPTGADTSPAPGREITEAEEKALVETLDVEPPT